MNEWEGVDFAALASRLGLHMADLLHRPDGVPLHRDAFYAEALRRTLTQGASGVVPDTYTRKIIDAHTAVDRANRQSAERRAAELLAEQATVRARMCDEIAEALDRVAENTNAVPSRLRREGVAYAAGVVRATAAYEHRCAAATSAKAAR